MREILSSKARFYNGVFAYFIKIDSILIVLKSLENALIMLKFAFRFYNFALKNALFKGKI